MSSIESMIWARTERNPRYRLFYWQCRALVVGACFWICVGRHERNRAEHIRGIEAKLVRQRYALRQQCEALARQNVRIAELAKRLGLPLAYRHSIGGILAAIDDGTATISR